MTIKNSGGVILFAQVNSFSYTNDALQTSLKLYLGDYELEVFRVYPAIRSNALLFVACILAVVRYYGISSVLNRKSLPEKVIKTPFFFWLSSLLVRRRAAKIANLRAILQTQGLFNGRVGRLPLFIYTDNTILNRINGASMAEANKSLILQQERELYNDADFIAVSASHVVTSLIEDYGVMPSVVRSILIGANSPVPAELEESRYRSQRILFVGIDWERKGGPDMIAAFRRVVDKFPDARLIIAGGNPEIENLPQVTTLGKIPQQQVSELMRGAAFYCMPSLVEPSSVAVIEAASSGLPILATAVGGFLDSVRDRETGILVQPRDVDALAAGMERLLADPELCATYGRAGRLLMQQFRWDIVSEKLAGEMRTRI